MANERIYWDTCILISWLTKQGDANFLAALNALSDDFDSGKKILVTSTLTRVEVLQCTLSDEQRTAYKNLFKRKNFQEIPITVPIVDLAHDIRDFYQSQKGSAKKKTVATADAIHLATAIKMEVSEFHTNDGGGIKRKRGLIALSGNVAGNNLFICCPFKPQSELELIPSTKTE